MSNLVATPSIDLRATARSLPPCLICARKCHCWQQYLDCGPNEHRCQCIRYLAAFDQHVTNLDLAQPDPTQAWRLAHDGVAGWLTWARRMAFELTG